MNIELLKRVMEGLGLSQEEAQAYLATRAFLSIQLANLEREAPGGPAAQIRPAWGYNFSTASVGDFSIIQPYNPADSGVVAHLSFCRMRLGANIGFIFRQQDTPLGAATGNTEWRDRNLPGLPAMEIRTHQAAAVGGSILIDFYYLLGYAGEITLDTWLYPGQGLSMAPDTNNTANRINFWWREYDYNPAA